MSWLFATDRPHEDTAWPESAQQIAAHPDRSASAERKMLEENALRLCPRLRE